MSSAAVMIGALRINFYLLIWQQILTHSKYVKNAAEFVRHLYYTTNFEVEEENCFCQVCL